MKTNVLSTTDLVTQLSITGERAIIQQWTIFSATLEIFLEVVFLGLVDLVDLAEEHNEFGFREKILELV